jgi:thiol:disulfide interchange protein DsbC
MKLLPPLALAFLLAVSTPSSSTAFMKDGCGAGSCVDCHTLSREEAGKLLAQFVDNVVSVSDSPVGGLWLVEVEKGGRRGGVYVDFSKEFVISGKVLQLSTMTDVTGLRTAALSRVDPSEIPLAGALVLGNAYAKDKVVVFDDPDCHFCGKLHEEMKKVVEKDPSVAFHIKVYSRNNNPETVRKAKSVVCARSMALLEDAFAGKAIPPPPAACKDTSVEETFRLAEKLTIRGTPTLILPDGRIIRGYRDAETLLTLLQEGRSAAGNIPRR